MTDRTQLERFGYILALLVVLVVNTLANAIPLGGQTTGEVSAKFPSLFTPAGYVFSIWGVIYLLLIVFVVWQLLPRQRNNPQLHKMYPVFLLSCFANAAWIFAWHYNQVLLSFIIMLVLLGALVWLYRELHRQPAGKRSGYWCCVLPFSVYTAWITVATIANLSTVQLHYGVQDFALSESHQAILKIALAAAIAISLLFHKRDAAFVLVVIWAAIGIAVKQADNLLISGAAGVVALLCAVLVCSPWTYQLGVK